MAINTVIFDFAGVLTREDFMPVMVRECSRRLGLDSRRLKKDFVKNELALQIGRLSLEDFWEIAGKGYGVAFEDFASVFINSYEIDPPTLTIARELAENYRVAILSDNFDLLSGAVRNDAALPGAFGSMFFSNELHMTKKEPACFSHVLRELGARAEECVMIDDSRANLASALAEGIQTIHFRGADRLKRSLERQGVSFSYSSASK